MSSGYRSKRPGDLRRHSRDAPRMPNTILARRCRGCLCQRRPCCTTRYSSSPAWKVSVPSGRSMHTVKVHDFGRSIIARLQPRRQLQFAEPAPSFFDLPVSPATVGKRYCSDPAGRVGMTCFDDSRDGLEFARVARRVDDKALRWHGARHVSDEGVHGAPALAHDFLRPFGRKVRCKEPSGRMISQIGAKM